MCHLQQQQLHSMELLQCGPQLELVELWMVEYAFRVLLFMVPVSSHTMTTTTTTPTTDMRTAVEEDSTRRRPGPGEMGCYANILPALLHYRVHFISQMSFPTTNQPADRPTDRQGIRTRAKLHPDKARASERTAAERDPIYCKRQWPGARASSSSSSSLMLPATLVVVTALGFLI